MQRVLFPGKEVLIGLVLAAGLLSAPAVCHAVPGGVVAEEIAHLFEFIVVSSCSFERNGTRYTGKEAAKHIRRKYTHFKDRIDSAESFIAYSATGSTMSGKPYLVYCGSETVISSAAWLQGELATYRLKSLKEPAGAASREGR